MKLSTVSANALRQWARCVAADGKDPEITLHVTAQNWELRAEGYDPFVFEPDRLRA